MEANPKATKLLLALNSAAALNTINAWRPLDRKGRASLLSFITGWPTSEMPLPSLGTQLAANVVAARFGAFEGWRRVANAALVGASAAGLLAVESVAKQAEQVYEQALQDGLGTDYQRRIAQLKHAGSDGATAGTPGVVRMLRIRRRFANDADIPYGPAGKANLLDIWRRRDLPAGSRAPVLLQVPGGGWTTGNKQAQAYPLMSHLAERGWICVAINYRLAPRNAWPAHIIDVKRAIAWVRENIAAYGGDPDFIAITGGSAGGHLSALAALTSNVRQWQPGFEDVDTTVSAAVPFYGLYDWLDRENVGYRPLVGFLEKVVAKTTKATAHQTLYDASPISHVTPQAPPFFVSHGTNDSLLPYEQARAFVRDLREQSRAPVVYAELPRAQHAFDFFGTPRGTAAAKAAGRFLGAIYGDYVNERGTSGSTMRAIHVSED